MATNHKLTEVIKGRTIACASEVDDKVMISFTDGSTLTVKTAGEYGIETTHKTVKAVRQTGTALNMDFEDGSTLTITTAEPTSSVMVRDKDRTLEYAD